MMSSGADETIQKIQYYSSSGNLGEDERSKADHDPEQLEEVDDHPHNLSRLAAMCTTNIPTYDDDDDLLLQGVHDDQVEVADHHHHHGIETLLSRLSIESFDDDGDEDDDEIFLDDGGGANEEIISELQGVLSSDSDTNDQKDYYNGCYSLPATPSRQNSYPSEIVYSHPLIGINGVKGYASENEVQRLMMTRNGRRSGRRRRRRRRRVILRSEKWVDSWGHSTSTVTSKQGVTVADDDDKDAVGGSGGGGGGGGCSSNNYNNNMSFSGESESGGSGGLRVITRAKGGRRSLCMDLEEVKACRDLGLELEHEGSMFELMPRRLSFSASTLDTTTTSSGGNSPIANWRISSPGDDPRDVKARLKVWAQAVALASSTFGHGS